MFIKVLTALYILLTVLSCSGLYTKSMGERVIASVGTDGNQLLIECGLLSDVDQDLFASKYSFKNFNLKLQQMEDNTLAIIKKYNPIPANEKDKRKIHRVKLLELFICNSMMSDKLIKFVDQTDEESLMEVKGEINQLYRRLVNNHQMLKTKLQYDLPWDLSKRVTDPILLEFIKRARVPVRLGDLFNFLTNQWQNEDTKLKAISNIETIKNHIMLDVTISELLFGGPMFLVNLLERFKFTSLKQEYKKLMIPLVLKEMIKLSSIMSMNTNQVKKILQEEVKEYGKRVKDLEGKKDNNNKDYLKRCKKIQSNGKAVIKKIAKGTFKKLTPHLIVATLVRKFPQMKETFLDEYTKALESIKNGYPYKGIVLKEGDILMNMSEPDDQFDDFIYFLGLKNAFVTHATIVTVKSCFNTKCYYVGEIMNKVQEKPILNFRGFNNVLIFRANYQIPEGFTERAFKSIAKEKVTYDCVCSQELRSEDGEISLYCSEVPHQCFKSEFGSGKICASPYDGCTTRLQKSDKPYYFSNLSKMGFNTTHEFYLGGNLLFSSKADNIGHYVRHDEKLLLVPGLNSFLAKLYKRLRYSYFELLTSKHFSKIKLFEKTKLKIGLLVMRVKMKAEFQIMRLPKGEALYHMWRYIKLSRDVANKVKKIEKEIIEKVRQYKKEKLSAKDLDDKIKKLFSEKGRKFDKFFNKKVVPQLKKYFSLNSQF